MNPANKKGFSVYPATHCAWRGFYVYWRTFQLGRVILDPEYLRPHLTVAVAVWVRRSCSGQRFPKLLEARIPLPHLRWRGDRGPVGRAAYRAFSWFWHGLDGRYGWKAMRRLRKERLRQEALRELLPR